MLANTLALIDDDDVTSHNFDLVSREGMHSVRRQTDVDSDLSSALVIKNTVDLSAPEKQNRHLIQRTMNLEDATTGEMYPVSVHVVIARHKKATDAMIKTIAFQLGKFIGTGANLDDILRGGN